MTVITVEVSCPATSCCYDYRLPIKMKAGEIKRQMIEDIRMVEGITELFSDEKKVTLYCSEGCIDDDMTPEYAGVRNGDKLMII